MSYDGITVSNRVENFSDRDLFAKVVDNVLTSATFASRTFRRGEAMQGKYKDFTVEVDTDDQFQWLGGGAESLDAAAVNNTILLSYARCMGVQPKVEIDFEAFANDGDRGVIDQQAYNYSRAVKTVLNELGTVVFGAGAGDEPNGLDAFCDNGTLKTTIGGQSKTTYTVLRGTYTDSDGIITAAKISTLDDAVSASGSKEGSPTVRVTTKTIWALIEELLTPFLSNQFSAGEMPKLPLVGMEALAPGEFGGRAGFTTLFYRNVAVLKDDKATTGSLYDANERTFGFYGNDRVPPQLKNRYEKVSFSQGNEAFLTTTDMSNAMPSTAGWFFKKDESMVTQLGTVGYVAVVGNVCVWEPRRNGQLYDITGLE
jgi:hypothetical protein